MRPSCVMKDIFSSSSFFYGDLMVPLSSVNEAIKPVIDCGVYQLINYRQWIVVFRARFIEVRIVDTHPVLPICFLNQHYIGHPFWVCDLSDEPCI